MQWKLTSCAGNLITKGLIYEKSWDKLRTMQDKVQLEISLDEHAVYNEF